MTGRDETDDDNRGGMMLGWCMIGGALVALGMVLFHFLVGVP